MWHLRIRLCSNRGHMTKIVRTYDRSGADHNGDTNIFYSCCMSKLLVLFGHNLTLKCNISTCHINLIDDDYFKQIIVEI